MIGICLYYHENALLRLYRALCCTKHILKCDRTKQVAVFVFSQWIHLKCDQWLYSLHGNRWKQRGCRVQVIHHYHQGPLPKRWCLSAWKEQWKGKPRGNPHATYVKHTLHVCSAQVSLMNDSYSLDPHQFGSEKNHFNNTLRHSNTELILSLHHILNVIHCENTKNG